MAVRPRPMILPRPASGSPRQRRSAVERLEESKANYVKSDHLKGGRVQHSEPPQTWRTLSHHHSLQKRTSPHDSSLEAQLRHLLSMEETGLYGMQDSGCSSAAFLDDLTPPTHVPLPRRAYSMSSSHGEDDGPYCSLTTSDYVSRSSSSYGRHLSDLERNCIHKNREGTPNPAAVQQLHSPKGKVAVTRSKSDVTHRHHGLRSPPPTLQKRNSYSSAELEHFFDTMGLDPRVWRHVVQHRGLPEPPSPTFSSDDHQSYFSSSVDSNCRPGPSYQAPCSPPNLTSLHLRFHADTSIVEKNARVIKWLYSCKKAQEESSPDD